jgi:sarcosine oxidase subunit gamma
MSALEFEKRSRCERFGIKGPRAAEWLEARGITLPGAPNQWTSGVAAAADTATLGELLVARLGTGEFFLEDCAGGSRVRGLEAALDPPQPGVYPVLREDAAFSLSGPGSYDVLAQVCNVNFADLELASKPVIMTLMIGVAVLIVPQMASFSDLVRSHLWAVPGRVSGDGRHRVRRQLQTANLRGDWE